MRVSELQAAILCAAQKLNCVIPVTVLDSRSVHLLAEGFEKFVWVHRNDVLSTMLPNS